MQGRKSRMLKILDLFLHNWLSIQLTSGGEEGRKIERSRNQMPDVIAMISSAFAMHVSWNCVREQKHNRCTSGGFNPCLVISLSNYIDNIFVWIQLEQYLMSREVVSESRFTRLSLLFLSLSLDKQSLKFTLNNRDVRDIRFLHPIKIYDTAQHLAVRQIFV